MVIPVESPRCTKNKKEVNKGDAQNDHRQRQTKIELYKAHPVAISQTGGRKKSDGAGLRGHNRQAHVVPGQGAVAHQKLVDIFITAAFPYAIGNNGEKRKAKNDPV
jgi:hypothetical protein